LARNDRKRPEPIGACRQVAESQREKSGGRKPDGPVLLAVCRRHARSTRRMSDARARVTTMCLPSTSGAAAPETHIKWT
jgi:hypothetical protein